MTGIITDIHRTSVVDGPGLRTTVFLKGCPLRCLWCHNPETQRFGIELAFDPDKCTGCGRCTGVCEELALSLRNKKAQLDRTRCTNCGMCVTECPSGSLFLHGRTVTDGEVVAEVLKDRAYYEASGGGVTVSGGEPMAQAEFALSILRQCRSLGIHTALDTCGFMSRQLCERTLDVTDLYLFDYKATGDEHHMKLTGVPLRPILDILEFLVSREARVILRCPLVPGVNDQMEHLLAISCMEWNYPSLERIDILTWHSMGTSKYARLGRTPATGLPAHNVPETTKDCYRDFFAKQGCRKVRFC
ncbi:MAG: glycyl-radical enzyme activating protein [Methylacidiphilales bacterium]|nr:glycyl-radical enzyme activating protein [Candidatus Methylacidiphilales bacterium]